MTDIEREYNERIADLPTLTVSIEVPQSLVDEVRELYELLQRVDPEENPARGRSFEQYLHDIALDRVEVDLAYPEGIDAPSE